MQAEPVPAVKVSLFDTFESPEQVTLYHSIRISGPTPAPDFSKLINPVER